MRLALGLELGGGGRRGFSKSTLSGQKFWFRADKVTLASTAVTDAADQSGNGYDVTQAAGAKRPVYTASDANFGGKPSMAFTASSVSSLDNTTSTPFTQSSPRTIYAVVRPTSAGGTVFDCKRGSPDFCFQMCFLSSYVFSNSAVNVQIASPPTLGSATFYVAWIDPGTGGTLIVRINGVSYALQGTPTIPAESASAAGFSVGSRPPFGQGFDGSMGEVMGYDTAHSAAQYGVVENYLKAKYAL